LTMIMKLPSSSGAISILAGGALLRIGGEGIRAPSNSQVFK
jgi:hypothetical protein